MCIILAKRPCFRGNCFRHTFAMCFPPQFARVSIDSSFDTFFFPSINCHAQFPFYDFRFRLLTYSGACGDLSRLDIQPSTLITWSKFYNIILTFLVYCINFIECVIQVRDLDVCLESEKCTGKYRFVNFLNKYFKI